MLALPFLPRHCLQRPWFKTAVSAPTHHQNSFFLSSGVKSKYRKSRGARILQPRHPLLSSVTACLGHLKAACLIMPTFDAAPAACLAASCTCGSSLVFILLLSTTNALSAFTFSWLPRNYPTLLHAYAVTKNTTHCRHKDHDDNLQERSPSPTIQHPATELSRMVAESPRQSACQQYLGVRRSIPSHLPGTTRQQRWMQYYNYRGAYKGSTGLGFLHLDLWRP